MNGAELKRRNRRTAWGVLALMAGLAGAAVALTLATVDVRRRNDAELPPKKPFREYAVTGGILSLIAAGAGVAILSRIGTRPD
jgi:hypothetical protein